MHYAETMNAGLLRQIIKELEAQEVWREYKIDWKGGCFIWIGQDKILDLITRKETCYSQLDIFNTLSAVGEKEVEYNDSKK